MSVRAPVSPFLLRGPLPRPIPVDTREWHLPWLYCTNVASAVCALFVLGVDPTNNTLCAAGVLYILWSPVLHASKPALSSEPLALMALLLGQCAALQLSVGASEMQHSEVLSAAMVLASVDLLLPWFRSGQHLPLPRALAVVSACTVTMLSVLAVCLHGTLAWRVHASTAPPLACLVCLALYLSLSPKPIAQGRTSV